MLFSMDVQRKIKNFTLAKVFLKKKKKKSEIASVLVVAAPLYREGTGPHLFI